MAGKTDKSGAKTNRTPWLDQKSNPQIQAYTERLSTFIEAMADGKIDEQEINDQEARVIALMKEIEPELPDTLHHQITSLLCELTAYNIMQTLHELAVSRPKTKFRG